MADERVLPQLVEQMLKELGEDPHREGLERTPERVASALRYLTSGYGKDVHEVLNDALFRDRIPTTENIAIAVWDLLAPKLGPDRLARVRVWEDPTLFVDYDGT